MGNALGQHFEKGRELFDARRFREAAAAFEREWKRLAAEGTLVSEDGVTLGQFLGLSLDATGDYARAAEVWERRRATQEETLLLRDGRGLNLTIEMLGRALLWSGAVEGALVVLERAVRIKQQDDARSLAQSMFDLAFALFFGGARDKAITVMSDCHKIRLSLAGAAKESQLELLCAKYTFWSFPEERDATLLEECRKIWTAAGKDSIVLLVRKNLLQLAVGLSRSDGGPERAVEVGTYCLLLVDNCEQGDSLLRAEVLNVLGIVNTAKAPQEACKTLREAVELLQRLKELDSPLGVRARVDLVNAMVAAGDNAAKAVSLSEECLAAVPKETELHARTLEAHAAALRKSGNATRADEVAAERATLLERLREAAPPSTPVKSPAPAAAREVQSPPHKPEHDAAEEDKKKEEVAKARAAEAKRKADEEKAKAAAAAAKAEVLKKEAEEKAKREAEAKRKAEEDKVKREADARRKAEEDKAKREQAKKKAEEETLAKKEAESKRLAEEESARKAEEAKKRAEEQKAKKAEEARAAAEAKASSASTSSVVEDREEKTKRIIAETRARALEKAKEAAAREAQSKGEVEAAASPAAAEDDETKRKEKAREEARARIAKRVSVNATADESATSEALAAAAPAAVPTLTLSGSSARLANIPPPRSPPSTRSNGRGTSPRSASPRKDVDEPAPSQDASADKRAAMRAKLAERASSNKKLTTEDAK